MKISTAVGARLPRNKMAPLVVEDYPQPKGLEWNSHSERRKKKAPLAVEIPQPKGLELRWGEQIGEHRLNLSGS